MHASIKKYKCVRIYIYIYFIFAQEKDGFVELFKNLVRYRSEDNFIELLNYVRCLNYLLECQNFLQYHSLCLRFLRIYFDVNNITFRFAFS